MDGKRTNPVFLSILLSFFLSISISFSTQPLNSQTQILALTSLPKPQTLSWPDSETETETQLVSEPDKTVNLLFDLYHVDSHSSMSHLSAKSLLKLLLKRDGLRANAISARAAAARKHRHGGFNSSVFSGLSQGSGEYFTRLGFGTPPKYMEVILDTGSDNIWLQCAPCKKCYEQSDPVFDPENSSSSSTVLCGSKICPAPCHSRKRDNNKTCPYQVVYGDGSFSSGDYMTETLTFRGTKLRKIIFGCGHDNEGLFVAAAGLLGLGRGKLSFPGQAGRRFRNKFSYCLVRRGSSGKSSILFGPTALSRKAVFTRLVHNPDPSLGTFYYVALEGISVGGKRVDIPPGVLELDREGNGGVILDSGTSVTRLAQPAYEAMRDAFQAWTKNLSQSSAFSLFDTCYDLSGMTEVTVPKVGLHFDGADMDLPAYNYLIPVDDNGKYCFAFAGKPSGLSIIGNIQQQGFRISYDLAKSRVGFTARSCV